MHTWVYMKLSFIFEKLVLTQKYQLIEYWNVGACWVKLFVTTFDQTWRTESLQVTSLINAVLTLWCNSLYFIHEPKVNRHHERCTSSLFTFHLSICSSTLSKLLYSLRTEISCQFCCAYTLRSNSSLHCMSSSQPTIQLYKDGSKLPDKKLYFYSLRGSNRAF